MSELSSFPPSQTKAICFPSGEKAAWSSVPARLVTGLIVNSGDGSFGFGRNRNDHRPKATTAPKTIKADGQTKRLIKELRPASTTDSTPKRDDSGTPLLDVV